MNLKCHDATPSWNGFSYQAKVGLYVVLLKMIEIGDEPNVLDQYSIEYEWLEDFSIKRNEKYESIHQVKHYSNNAYKDALEILSKKVQGHFGASDLNVVITECSPDLKKKKEKEKKTKLCTELFEWLIKAKCINKDGKVQADWSIDRIPSHLVIYKESIEKFLNSWEQFVSHMTQVENAYFHISADHKLKDQPKVTQYTYENQGSESAKQFCRDDELKRRIEALIREWYAKEKSPPTISVSGPFLCLLGLIDSHVSNRHNNMGKASKVIGFREIVKTLSSLDLIDTSDEYKAFCLKESFVEAYEYSRRKFLDLGHEEELQRLDEMMDSVNQTYEGKFFLGYARRISPDGLPAGFKSGKDVLYSRDVQKYYFKFFVEVIENMELQPVLEGKKYHPSTLSIDNHDELIDISIQVCENLSQFQGKHDRFRFVAEFDDQFGEHIPNLHDKRSRANSTKVAFQDPTVKLADHIKEPAPISLHKGSTIIARLNEE